MNSLASSSTHSRVFGVIRILPAELNVEVEQFFWSFYYGLGDRLNISSALLSTSSNMFESQRTHSQALEREFVI